jgi:DNA-binding transcriptional regulator YbjK
VRYAPGKARRAEILNATVNLIYERGISAVTHRAVAEGAGVRPSAPSYFFPSIDDLIVEAFGSIMTAMVADLEELSAQIEHEDMTREQAVDAYIAHAIKASARYDKLQFEAYIFSDQKPALRAEVERTLAATHRPASTLVTASRRKDLDWAAPILTALVDGFGLYRLALPGRDEFEGLRTGLLALMEALPGRDPSAADDPL